MDDWNTKLLTMQWVLIGIYWVAVRSLICFIVNFIFMIFFLFHVYCFFFMEKEAKIQKYFIFFFIIYFTIELSILFIFYH